jgi:phage tail protein X
VRLQAGAGIGSGAQHLELEALLLTARAGSTGLFLTEATAVTVTEVALNTVARVDSSGASGAGPADAAQSGLASGGALVLQTTVGGILLAADGAVTAAGNLLLWAQGSAADLDVRAAVSNSAGETSLAAGRDLLLGANVAATATGKTIDLLAYRHLLQAQGTSVASTNANVALEAQTGNASLETITAGTAGIRVAAVAIVDGDLAGDAEVDLTAASVQLTATGTGVLGAIGASGAQLETAATTLTARGAGDVFISDTSALVIDLLTLNVQRVGSTGGVAATTHAAQTGLAAISRSRAAPR